MKPKYFGKFKEVQGLTDEENEMLRKLYFLAEKGRLRGFYGNIPDPVYHAAPGISNSGLKLIKESPFHFYNEYADYKYESTPEKKRNLVIGQAFHCLIFEPDEYPKRFFESDAKNRRCAEFNSDVSTFEDQTVLSKPEWTKLRMMADTLSRHRQAGLLNDPQGKAEQVVFSVCPVTGVLLRGKIDRIASGYIWDAKTCQDAGSRKFSRVVEDNLYYMQIAFYRDIVDRELKQINPSYRGLLGGKIIATEKSKKPYVSQIYDLCDFSHEIGQRHYQLLVNRYAECLESGKWPLESLEYSEKGKTLTVSEWVDGPFKQLEEIENE